MLCYFVAYLGERGLGHGTIKSYLAAVRSLQIDYGLHNPFDRNMPRLDRILKGLKVSQGKQGRVTRRKLPITPKILRQICSRWTRVGSDYGETMLWAAATVCFFGFLRAGELVVDTVASFDPDQHLTLQDVATDSRQHPGLIQLTIKCSKTDLFRIGVDVVLGATHDELCPVQALFWYLELRGGIPGPLFMLQDRTPLTRSVFVKGIRQALSDLGYTNSLQYSGHSFRAGAATTAVAMNVEDSIIKTLGR